ncbi:MAG: hypothetical protein HQL03_03535 [Nitrospirae bacterium]|nr:hypothetical protein [Nitrospirota bacterium]
MEQLSKVKDMSSVAITLNTLTMTPELRIAIKMFVLEALKKAYISSQAKGLKGEIAIKPDTVAIGT